MKKTLLSLSMLLCITAFSQDKTKPVEIFSSQKVINANTPELTGKGKMDFLVTHNFEDIGGSRGGIKNFFNRCTHRLCSGCGKKYGCVFIEGKSGR
jgi:hypothetical protein